MCMCVCVLEQCVAVVDCDVGRAVVRVVDKFRKDILRMARLGGDLIRYEKSEK